LQSTFLTKSLLVVVSRKQKSVVGGISVANEVLGLPGGLGGERNTTAGIDVVTAGSDKDVVVELNMAVTEKNVLAVFSWPARLHRKNSGGQAHVAGDLLHLLLDGIGSLGLGGRDGGDDHIFEHVGIGDVDPG